MIPENRKWFAQAHVYVSTNVVSQHRALRGVLLAVFLGRTLEFGVPRALFCSSWFLCPIFAAKSRVTQYIQTLRWPLSTHAPLLESVMFSRIPLGVRKTLLHGGGVTSCGTYGHQSGQQVIPPTAPLADPLCWKGSRWASFTCCFLWTQGTQT